jgi:drug/metabolite transporter (DMT)-like permease
MRTALCTAAALIAFAANSLLCRLALMGGAIDAASFTGLRLASGAVVLALLAGLRQGDRPRSSASWISGAALFAYAAPFSFAYLRLGTGVGALVLFGSVQATMIGWGIARGERPRFLVWLGLAIAMAGLVALAAPGRTAPDPLGVGLMAIAGAAWGVYTLRGRQSGSDPVVANAAAFLRSVPLAAVLVALGASGAAITGRGALLAIASGALASGVGYAVWYAALRGLTVTRAAVLQLLVPVLAAAGGVLLLGESATSRLLLAAAGILGGVALAIRGRS